MPNASDTTKVGDGFNAIVTHNEDQPGGTGAPERQTYVVESEAGLFKNGQQYDKGEEVQLDERTAANFIAAGDIKETE